MRTDEWVPVAQFNPMFPGHYLVTTHKDKIMIDRWDGESSARCVPRITYKGMSKGKYKLHKAWTRLPSPYKEMTDDI